MRSFFSPNSLIGRLLRLFTRKSHDVLDSFDDPGSDARQMLRDLQHDIAESEEALAAVMAEETLVKRSEEASRTKASEWATKAEAALAAGNQALADKALSYAEREAGHARSYAASLRQLSPRVADLSAKVTELRRKKEDADTEIHVLDARARAAKATARAARTLGATGNTTVRFDDVRNKVDRLEAESDALGKIAHDKSTDPIDVAFVELETRDPASRLAALRSSLGTPVAVLAPAVTQEG